MCRCELPQCSCTAVLLRYFLWFYRLILPHGALPLADSPFLADSVNKATESALPALACASTCNAHYSTQTAAFSSQPADAQRRSAPAAPDAAAADRLAAGFSEDDDAWLEDPACGDPQFWQRLEDSVFRELVAEELERLQARLVGSSCARQGGCIARATCHHLSCDYTSLL